VSTVAGLLTALRDVQTQQGYYLRQITGMRQQSPEIRAALATIYLLLRDLDRLVAAVASMQWQRPPSSPDADVPDPPEVMYGYGGYQIDSPAPRPTLDVFTGKQTYPGAEPANSVQLSWWPAVPVVIEGAGVLELDCDPQYLMIEKAANPVRLKAARPTPTTAVAEIVGYAETFAQSRMRAINVNAEYRAAYPALRRSGLSVRAAKRALGSRPRLAGQTVAMYEALADRVAAVLASALTDLADSAGRTLNELGVIMPAAIGTPSVITSTAQTISDAVRQGVGTRVALGSDTEAAFSWALGLPRTLVSLVSSASSSARHLDVTIAKDSGAALTPIPEGAAKPAGVTLTTETVDMAKYGGYAELTTESVVFVTNVANAVSAVLVGRILRGIEADIVTAVQAGAGITVTGEDATSAVIAAQAAVLGNGGAPSVVALSPTDYAAIMSTVGAGGYQNFSTPEAGPGLWLGMVPAVVPGLATGTVLVLDGNAVTVFEAAGGPLVIADPFSDARHNKITIVVESFDAVAVTAPGAVAVGTVSGP
jgi:hypothetical protein